MPDPKSPTFGQAPAEVPQPTPRTPESPAEELARLRKEEAARQEVSDSEEEARELEELRLVSQLTLEGQKRGKDFEVVNTPFGVFGVRRPDTQGVRQWDKAQAATPVDVDRIIGILKNYIIPAGPKQNEFHLAATERPGLATGNNGVGVAFLSLIGSVRFDAKKK